MAEMPPRHFDLDELREWLRPRLEEPGGVECPVCRQHAQAYRRQVTRRMVEVMGRMLRWQTEHPDRWVHLADQEQKSRDTTMLAYWNLITERPGHRGEWRVTDEGDYFLRGQLSILKYAHVYRGKVVGFSGEQIDVFNVAPGFDFDALMRGE